MKDLTPEERETMEGRFKEVSFLVDAPYGDDGSIAVVSVFSVERIVRAVLEVHDKAREKETCVAHLSDSDENEWTMQCGDSFGLGDDSNSPMDAGMKFCPNCGRRIELKKEPT